MILIGRISAVALASARFSMKTEAATPPDRNGVYVGMPLGAVSIADWGWMEYIIIFVSKKQIL